MKKVLIRRPSVTDIDELGKFFSYLIKDTYNKEGIGHLLDDQENEIKTKKANLRLDLESNGEKRYFLIAIVDEMIVGTIEIGPPNEIIVNESNGNLADCVEVGTVYVHPDYQKQGIGSQLLTAILKVLKNRGIKEFCLDCGYKEAQIFWQKKFGEPTYFLKDYWSEGSHHMIWKIELES